MEGTIISIIILTGKQVNNIHHVFLSWLILDDFKQLNNLGVNNNSAFIGIQ
jgi:hypothetical protein